MTPSQLKARYQQADPDGHYFDRETMRFFGDRMSNYGVRAATVTDYTGQTREVWELYRKHAVKHGLRASHYFDRETMDEVFAAE